MNIYESSENKKEKEMVKTKKPLHPWISKEAQKLKTWAEGEGYLPTFLCYLCILFLL